MAPRKEEGTKGENKNNKGGVQRFNKKEFEVCIKVK